MRLFKTMQASRSAEDEAAAGRLMAIASRTKPIGLQGSASESPAKSNGSPEGPEVPQ